MPPSYSPSTQFGPVIVADGVRFRLWAPVQDQVSIVLDDSPPRLMTTTGGGWHEIVDAGAKPGSRYQFQLGDGLLIPDPASRYQPDDVHGPSEIIDPDHYSWNDSRWRGRPWEECVLYELHIGTFTQEGTFIAAIEHLDWLVELGVTAIEIMPVADFPGRRNWGYDGVLLFAPDAQYGRPEDFKALVDAAHAKGIMVLLDVVYNHFGPDGNYLPLYAQIFNPRHQTPWGNAINFDAEGSDKVRAFVIENAVTWINDFHLDGLRLDAVHAIRDDSEISILDDLATAVRASVGERIVHLVVENEDNEAALIRRTASGEPQFYTAQWNDDVHHVMHVAATGESAGYYAKFAGDTEKLACALAHGYATRGNSSSGDHGAASTQPPPAAFVAFIQNHDQVGNRAFGDRLTSSAPAAAVQAIASIYLLLPQIPMIFMGEEYGASQPFPFFCDFEGDLANAVREGRRAEFGKFPEFQDPRKRALIPDPTSEATFQSAKLDWSEASSGKHAQWLDFYRQLLAIRHRDIIPRLKGMDGNSGEAEVLGQSAVAVSWRMGDGAKLHLAANLRDQVLQRPAVAAGRQLFKAGDSDATSLGAWSVVWSIDDRTAHL